MSHEGILFSIELPPVYSNLIDTNHLISRLLTRANCVKSSIDREIHQSEMEICVADVFSWERFRCRIYFLAIFSRSEQKKIEESDMRPFLDLVPGLVESDGGAVNSVWIELLAIEIVSRGKIRSP